MKRRFLYLLVPIFCMSAYASSEDCGRHTKENIRCNIEPAKSVTGDKKLLSGTDTFELSPVSLLLFEI
jgi:hypothetical protein